MQVDVFEHVEELSDAFACFVNGWLVVVTNTRAENTKVLIMERARERCLHDRVNER